MLVGFPSDCIIYRTLTDHAQVLGLNKTEIKNIKKAHYTFIVAHFSIH